MGRQMKPGNFEFKILACGQETFDKAFSILFSKDSNYGREKTVVSFSVNSDEGLILYTYAHTNPKAVSLPYKMNEQAARAFAWNWLNSEEAEEVRGGEPDIDGSVHPDAFTIANIFYGDAIQIKPCWSEYHK